MNRRELRTGVDPFTEVQPGLNYLRSYVSYVFMSEKQVLFMSEANRLNWLSGTRRAQQNAPPNPLPHDTVSIYTDGSAIPRKLGQPPPPAGYGLKAVTGGAGPEHVGGRELYEECGQINARSSEHPHVLTTTSNLAELVAFTRTVDSRR